MLTGSAYSARRDFCTIRVGARDAPRPTMRSTPPSPAAPGSFLRVEQLSLAARTDRRRPPVAILTGVSFTVERGTALVLVGPSGSGKSSLLRCLNRLVEPTAGRVILDGRDITALDPLALRRRAALVLQTPVLFEGTVRDNLKRQPPAANADVSEPRLVRALADVGLDPGMLDRDGGTLSGGERQRVTIARALLAEPEMLLLDEPTASLDPPNAALVVETIAALQRACGLTIVAVTHQPELIQRLGGALLYLVHGRVEAYEHAHGGAIGDVRLRAFLAGEGRRPSA